MPQRIQQKRLAGWRKPDGAISVVRPRKWGNPYPVSVHGQAGAIKKYRTWLQRQIELERLDLTELQGHPDLTTKHGPGPTNTATS